MRYKSSLWSDFTFNNYFVDSSLGMCMVSSFTGGTSLLSGPAFLAEGPATWCEITIIFPARHDNDISAGEYKIPSVILLPSLYFHEYVIQNWVVAFYEKLAGEREASFLRGYWRIRWWHGAVCSSEGLKTRPQFRIDDSIPKISFCQILWKTWNHLRLHLDYWFVDEFRRKRIGQRKWINSNEVINKLLYFHDSLPYPYLSDQGFGQGHVEKLRI